MAKKLTSAKAKKILHDKSVHGKPLTDKQRRFFGAIASGAEPYKKAQFGTGYLSPITNESVSNFIDLLSVPQKAITKLVTGKYQTPSEAMKIKNEAGAIATDIVLDPINLLGGAGLLSKGAKATKATKATKVANLVGKNKNGGWLDKYEKAQKGKTLMGEKTIGELRTPITSLDLRKVIYDFKPYQEVVYDPNCPDPTGLGCSYQATRNAQKMTGLPLESYAPADAAYKEAVAKRQGLLEIFGQKDPKQQKVADSRAANWTFPTEEDFTKWKVGDMVTLDAGEDYIFNYAPPPGFSSEDNANNSHVGVIVGFTEKGRPIIRHGLATGKGKGMSYTEELGEDNRVRSLGHGRYAIKSVIRPKEISDDGLIESVETIKESAQERAARKANTKQQASFYLNNSNEQNLAHELPVAAELSGASSRLATKNKIISFFNDEELDKELQYKLGITSRELNDLKPVVYGIAGQESSFGDTGFLPSLKDLPGNLLNLSNSKGTFQVKFNSLTKKERELVGVKKPNDLLDDEKAYKAAMLLLNNSRKRMNKEIEEGTHPELADKDENFRAAYYYNQPARAITPAEKWAKQTVPVGLNDPLGFLYSRERGSIFGKPDPNYKKKIELRMDEGSYPYKLMEHAKDLGVDYDFETPSELEEVVIYGNPKDKNKRFVKKENGGWLDKYDAPKAQNGIEGTMGGLTDKGFNYNGAWGGTMQTGGNLMPAMAGANQTVPMAQLGDSVKPITMQLAMGGSLPGAVGFTYARTINPAPANGPYAKKTKASAQDGEVVMKGKEFVENWMSSPMYKEMLEKSAQGPEFERINRGRISNLNIPVNVSTDINLYGTETLGQKQHRVRTMLNATGPELQEMMKVLQTAVDNPKDKEAKRKAEELTQPVITGWNIGMNPNLKPGTLDYEAVLAHEYGHTIDDPFISKLPNQMSKKELMSQDLLPYIPKSDIEKMQSYYQGKVNDDLSKYLSKPQETRQFLTSLRYLGKAQGVYDPFTEKITPEQYRKIKPTELNDPAGMLRKIYTDEQIIDMLNSISKTQRASGVPMAQDGKKLSYSQWKKQYNLKETPDYNLKRAWKLGYTPDKTGHLPTVDNQTGQFLKAKGHPTLQLELDWYNSPEAADFRSKNVIDSSGKFFKYVPKGQNGQEMKYYQEGLDFKPKTISQDGVRIDPMGYWNPENVGEPVIIPSNIITMEGVDQPLIGISNTGDIQYMEPGGEYEFEGESVLEMPVARSGVSVNNADAQPLKKLDQLLNFTNYNKPTRGGWLDKYK